MRMTRRLRSIWTHTQPWVCTQGRGEALSGQKRSRTDLSSTLESEGSTALRPGLSVGEALDA